ncbi:unnamed protein product [Nesidiocoris tenuis]|uniref:Uncharacterized protein n=1 Tax=Nesidiocoris tenuis TaxID=355587 RepID=A0A6H5G1L5_9HEMI|nr:unnamed protein product [Nesidiocoris tenuis]
MFLLNIQARPEGLWCADPLFQAEFDLLRSLTGLQGILSSVECCKDRSPCLLCAVFQINLPSDGKIHFKAEFPKSSRPENLLDGKSVPFHTIAIKARGRPGIEPGISGFLVRPMVKRLRRRTRNLEIPVRFPARADLQPTYRVVESFLYKNSSDNPVL